MSRSEKKVPIIRYYVSQYNKKFANRIVRHSDVGNNSNYKKLYNSYNICNRRSRLFKHKKMDGIPVNQYTKEKMTIEEINEYWRK